MQMVLTKISQNVASQRTCSRRKQIAGGSKHDFIDEHLQSLTHRPEETWRAKIKSVGPKLMNDMGHDIQTMLIRCVRVTPRGKDRLIFIR